MAKVTDELTRFLSVEQSNHSLSLDANMNVEYCTNGKKCFNDVITLEVEILSNSVVVKCCFNAFISIQLKERFNMLLMMVSSATLEPRLHLALLLLTLNKATRGCVTSSATSAPGNPFIQDAEGAAMGGERSYVQETKQQPGTIHSKDGGFFFFSFFERKNDYCKKGSSSIPNSCKTDSQISNPHSPYFHYLQIK